MATVKLLAWRRRSLLEEGEATLPSLRRPRLLLITSKVSSGLLAPCPRSYFIHPDSVRRLIRQGKIPAFKFAKKRLIRKDELVQLSGNPSVVI